MSPLTFATTRRMIGLLIVSIAATIFARPAVAQYVYQPAPDYYHNDTASGTIPGGAATVLGLPLDPGKELKSLTVRALANDVVIGLMAVTLER